ncbi:CCR4-NOT transcription complex subunit 3 [Bienertia sinuspersici]
MGASRKLQGEIDRVLKKVQEGVDVFDSIWNKVYDTDNANQKEKFEADLKKEIKKLQRYRDQIKTWIQSSEIKDKKALVDARKLIEREMERFKVCEKETKTKAFSKEGLGQQPKTDPKEKAKSETRDWLNNVVGELESQIDNFEAEMEGLSVKKGKARPPRLTHLETSIARHKAHIMKLELILRLLDNDELSAEHVNDVKDFLEDYVERNQEDFEEFSDVDEFYSALPLDKVESLEDLVTMGQPGLAKGGGANSSVLSMKTSSNTTSLTSATVPPPQLSVPIQEQDETNSQDSNSDTVPKTPPSKTSILSPSNTSNAPAIQTATANSSMNTSASPSTSASVPGPVSGRGILEGAIPTSPLNPPSVSKEEEAVNLPARRSSPALTDPATLSRGIGRGSISNQPAVSAPLGAVASSSMTLGATPLASDVAKRNILGSDERLASSVVAGRAFSSSMVPGMQWRGSSFQSQSELGQFRGRTEIAPDQREKFLQRLQQVQQQGHSNILGMPGLGGGNSKQFSGQQQNPLLQQLTSQSSSMSSQVGLGLGLQSPGLSTVSSAPVQLQPISIHQQSAQPGSLLVAPKDSEDQQQQNLSEDSSVEITPGSGLTKNLMNDDDLKASYVKDVSSGGTSGPPAESAQLTRDADFSPGQPLQSSQSSSSLGVIGRRSVSDLGAIGDNIGGTANSGGVHDSLYNMQMLEAAYYKLPQPKDSERAKSYTPRHPAATPPSYPQVQAPIVNNPAFWERLAKELKKQSWRYHRKFNTWFQRHEEPKVATDECEQGTYVYFDFHLANDDPNQGWCQRIKADFTFEYSYLEDELIV